MKMSCSRVSTVEAGSTRPPFRRERSLSLRTRGRRPVAVALTAALLLVASVPVSAAESGRPFAPTPTEDLTGVLGMAVAQDGSFYLAESFAGQLTRVDKHGNREVVANGQFAGVDAQGRGNLVVTETVPPEFGGLPDTYLSRVGPNGRVTRLASLSDHEAEYNPDQINTYGLMAGAAGEAAFQACLGDIDGDVREIVDSVVNYPGIVESNPYAVASIPGGYLVADAAGNTILQVSANGERIETVAVLPPQDPITVDADLLELFEELVGWELAGPEGEEPVAVTLPDCLLGQSWVGEPVPTDVEVGPEGNYYLTTLPGVPEAPGTGALWMIDARTHELTLVADGFSGAVDLAIAADGTVYVAELFASQVSVVKSGTILDTIALPLPGAVEVGPDGAVYAAIGTFFGPGGGSVVQIAP